MKAAILEKPGQPLVLRDDVTLRDPGIGQVRVKVSHCGICHSDLSIADGAFPAPLPIVLGHEAAGVVDAVGAGVTHLAPGDPVILTPCPPCGTCYYCLRSDPSLCQAAAGILTHTFPDGSTGLTRGDAAVYRGLNVAGFAEYTVTAANGAVKIPEGVPLETACVIGCAVQTGVGAVLNTARVEEGATVLVLGLGGIGLSAVQGARLAGAARIVVSDPVAQRREAAKALGATDFIDPASDDVALRALAISPVGLDYAFECAGSAALVQTGLSSVRNGGTVVCVGAPPIDQAITIAPAAAFVISEKKLVGCTLGSSNSLREIPRLVALWQAGRLDLDALITARRPLADINAAMDELRESRGIRTVLEL